MPKQNKTVFATTLYFQAENTSNTLAYFALCINDKEKKVLYERHRYLIDHHLLSKNYANRKFETRQRILENCN